MTSRGQCPRGGGASEKSCIRAWTPPPLSKILDPRLRITVSVALYRAVRITHSSITVRRPITVRITVPITYTKYNSRSTYNSTYNVST